MTATSTAPIRVGAVSFVNTAPLIDGLEVLRDVELRPSVPSVLIDELDRGELDVALCSSIDAQRAADRVVVLPCGQLGCDGATLTVRLYSQCPIERITRVHCDTDSHTSVVLMQIVLAERLALLPEIVAYDAREHVADGGVVDWPLSLIHI